MRSGPKLPIFMVRKAAPVGAGLSPLLAPDNPAAALQPDDSVDLTATDTNTTETGHRWEKSTDGGVSWSTIGTITADVLDFTDPGPVTPTVPSPPGSPIAWLNAYDNSKMWQDIAKTIPVTANGDPIAYWEDSSGNGNDFTQSDNARRPVWRETFVEFTNDWMIGPDLSANTDGSLACRMRMVDSGGGTSGGAFHFSSADSSTTAAHFGTTVVGTHFATFCGLRTGFGGWVSINVNLTTSVTIETEDFTYLVSKENGDNDINLYVNGELGATSSHAQGDLGTAPVIGGTRRLGNVSSWTAVEMRIVGRGLVLYGAEITGADVDDVTTYLEGSGASLPQYRVRALRGVEVGPPSVAVTVGATETLAEFITGFPNVVSFIDARNTTLMVDNSDLPAVTSDGDVFRWWKDEAGNPDCVAWGRSIIDALKWVEDVGGQNAVTPLVNWDTAIEAHDALASFAQRRIVTGEDVTLIAVYTQTSGISSGVMATQTGFGSSGANHGGYALKIESADPENCAEAANSGASITQSADVSQAGQFTRKCLALRGTSAGVLSTWINGAKAADVNLPAGDYYPTSSPQDFHSCLFRYDAGSQAVNDRGYLHAAVFVDGALTDQEIEDICTRLTSEFS